MGSTSSIATAVNSKIIKSMPFVLPTEKELTDFHVVTYPMFRQIKENQRENTRLASLRDALLPKLMSGEIDVSKVNISADKLSFRCRSPPKNISYRFSCYFPLNSVICDIFIRQFVEFFSHISSLFLHYLLDIILFPSIHCVVLTR